MPQTKAMYTPILDHGIRSETRGVVIHVNAGYYEGTISFFTNGRPEPWGSEGVGAHFEIGGHGQPPVQFLPLDRVAWHAVDANSYTIGVEHVGFGASAQEWTTENFNVIGQSAYRVAWILAPLQPRATQVQPDLPGPEGHEHLAAQRWRRIVGRPLRLPWRFLPLEAVADRLRTRVLTRSGRGRDRDHPERADRPIERFGNEATMKAQSGGPCGVPRRMASPARF